MDEERLRLNDSWDHIYKNDLSKFYILYLILENSIFQITLLS